MFDCTYLSSASVKHTLGDFVKSLDIRKLPWGIYSGYIKIILFQNNSFCCVVKTGKTLLGNNDDGTLKPVK